MSSPSLSDRAYSEIQRRILSGEMPQGAQVSELSLAKDIGVSRTPVREAIRRLQVEGLVEQVPRFGTIVRTVTPAELTELFEVREALECLAAAKAAQRIDEAQLAELEQHCLAMLAVGDALQAENLAELTPSMLRSFLASDLAFHMVVIKAAGNGRIARMVNDTRTITRIFSVRRQTHDLSIVLEAHGYHARILSALRARDAARARDEMSQHLQASLRESLAYFASHPPSPEEKTHYFDPPEYLLPGLNPTDEDL